MAEVARLIHLLQTSAERPYYGKVTGTGDFSAFAAVKNSSEVEAEVNNNEAKREPIPCSLVEALQHVTNGQPLPPKPSSPALSEGFKLGLTSVLQTVNAFISQDVHRTAPSAKLKNSSDFANDLAVANCKRIFSASKEPSELDTIVSELNLPVTPFTNLKFDKMAGRLPVLNTSDLPQATAQENSATASPARGSAMLSSIFKSVRVPEFRFKWQFWAEKGTQNPPSKSATGAEEYASRPKPLGEQIISVKEFYQHFNNIPVDSLKLRDSIHLFHHGVKPIWEDPRNDRGGAYYFRVSKEVAPEFWHEICLLAVGDVLQGAVETKRASFNDDICGISYSVRWNAVQIAIWNRDADNEVGKEKLIKTILEKLSDKLQPKKDSYWYKPHKDHKGFQAPI